MAQWEGIVASEDPSRQGIGVLVKCGLLWLRKVLEGPRSSPDNAHRSSITKTTSSN